MTRILGLDPGSIHMGYGVVEASAGRLRHLDHGTLSAPRSWAVARRLAALHAGLEEVLDRHRPDSVAIERVFTARNVASALTLGQARGTALLAVGQRELDLAEYAPGAVKLAVVGHGRASKEQVAQMVGRLLGIGTDGMGRDSSDALAIAICHSHGLERAHLLRRAGRSG